MVRKTDAEAPTTAGYAAFAHLLTKHKVPHLHDEVHQSTAMLPFGRPVPQW
jgi:hypothetical protein